MYGIGSISRKDESKFPEFSSHVEARNWFQDKYGESFVLADSEMIGDEKCYFYILVINPDVYWDGQLKLAKGESVPGMDFLFSHQKVEIFESGAVHVVH